MCLINDLLQSSLTVQSVVLFQGCHARFFGRFCSWGLCSWSFRADTSESSPCSLVGWFSACLGSSGASTTGARSTVSSMGSVPEGFAGFSCRVLTIFSCSTPLDCVWTVEAPSTGVFLVPSTGVSVYVFSDPSAGFSTTFFTGTSVGVFNGSSTCLTILSTTYILGVKACAFNGSSTGFSTTIRFRSGLHVSSIVLYRFSYRFLHDIL